MIEKNDVFEVTVKETGEKFLVLPVEITETCLTVAPKDDWYNGKHYEFDVENGVPVGTSEMDIAKQELPEPVEPSEPVEEKKEAVEDETKDGAASTEFSVGEKVTIIESDPKITAEIVSIEGDLIKLSDPTGEYELSGYDFTVAQIEKISA